MLQTGICTAPDGRARWVRPAWAARVECLRAERPARPLRSQPATAYSREQRMRIVSLVPHATELLFALGLGEQVAGVTHECDYPPRAQQLARVTRDVLPA